MKISYSRIKSVGDNPPEPVDFTQDYAEEEMLKFIFSDFSRQDNEKSNEEIDEFLIETYNNAPDKSAFKQIVQSALNEIMGMTVAEVDPLILTAEGKKIHSFFEEAYSNVRIKDMFKQKRRLLSEPDSPSMSLSNVEPLSDQDVNRYIKNLEYSVGISEGDKKTTKTITLNELENNNFDEDKSVERRSIVAFEDFRTNQKPRNKIEKLFSLGFSEFNLDTKASEVLSLQDPTENKASIKDIEESLRFDEDYSADFDKIDTFGALIKSIGFVVMRAMYISYNTEFRENIVKLLKEGKVLGAGYSEVNSETVKDYPLDRIVEEFKEFAKAFSKDISDEFESDLKMFAKQRNVERFSDELSMNERLGRDDLIETLTKEYERIVVDKKDEFKDITTKMQDMIKGLKGEVSLGALSSLNEIEIEMGGEEFGLGELLSLEFEDLPKQEEEEEVEVIEREDERTPKVILKELEENFAELDEIEEEIIEVYSQKRREILEAYDNIVEATKTLRDKRESLTEKGKEQYKKQMDSLSDMNSELYKEWGKTKQYVRFIRDEPTKFKGKTLPKYTEMKIIMRDNLITGREGRLSSPKDIPIFERPLRVVSAPGDYGKKYDELKKNIKTLQQEYKDKIKPEKISRNRLNVIREKMEEEGYYEGGAFTNSFIDEVEDLLLELNDDEAEEPIKKFQDLKSFLEREGITSKPVDDIIGDLSNARPINHESIEGLRVTIEKAIKGVEKKIKLKFEKSMQTEEKKINEEELVKTKAKSLYESISFDGKSLKLGKLMLQMRGNKYLRDPRGLYKFTIKVNEKDKDGSKSYSVSSYKVELLREINTKRLPSATGSGEDTKRRQRTKVGTQKFKEVTRKESFARFVDSSAKLDDLEAALTEMI